ncbi:MAG: hypothetical protein AAF682_14320 [Planctomycetota bacterium]
MKTQTAALTTLALTLLPAGAGAQNWLRGEYENVLDLRLLARADGTLVDLGREDGEHVARLRLHDHGGENLTTLRLEALLGGTGEPTDMGLFSDGDVAIVGEHHAEDGSSWSPFLGRFDPATGLAEWLVRVPWLNYGYDRVVVDDDICYAVGKDATETSITLARFDPNGSWLWCRNFGLTGSDLELIDACPAPGGGVLVAMRDLDDSTHLLAVDADGAQLWRRMYDGVEVEAVTLTASGQVWVGGEGAGEQTTVLALDAAGVELWAKEYLGYPVFFDDILPTPGGGVVLTLTRVVGGAYAPSLLALDASGGVQWSHMYDIANGYPYQGANETVDVGDRGFVLRAQVEADNHYLAVDPDGGVDLPCVGVTGLATLAQPTSVASSAPPSSFYYTLNQITEGWLLQPLADSASLDLDCGDPCSATLASFGAGLAGTGALMPELDGVSGACVGAPHPRIELTKGLGGTIGVFGYAFSTTSLPAFGGTLYLNPQTLQAFPIVLDGAPGVSGAGTWELELQTELVSLIGASVYMQAALADDGAPEGWSMSAALVMSMG